MIAGTVNIRLLGLLACLSLIRAVSAEPVSYYNDLRPVIQRSCQGCHQPATKMGGLDLTSFEAIEAGGGKGAILKAGAPAESRVLAMLSGASQPRMPMGQDALADEEIELFRQWIAEGASDDTPASARAPAIPSEPPVYKQPPVITAVAYSPDGSTIAVGGY